MRQAKLRRKQQREAANQNVSNRKVQVNHGLELMHIKPLTFTQARVFREYDNGQNLVLHGFAGVGKTFLALYKALQSVESGDYRKVIIVRSLVATRDIGFLPGDVKTKSEVYEAPYQSICADLYGRDDAYGILKNKGQIEFLPTSFVRGITIDNAIIIIDEAQSLNFHELNSILTRVGQNTRIILAGDYRQSDLTKDSERKGFLQVLKRLQKIDNVSFIEFVAEDIVRSGFVRAWILSEFE